LPLIKKETLIYLLVHFPEWPAKCEFELTFVFSGVVVFFTEKNCFCLRKRKTTIEYHMSYLPLVFLQLLLLYVDGAL